MSRFEKLSLTVAVLLAYCFSWLVFPNGDGSGPVILFLPLIGYANIGRALHGDLPNVVGTLFPSFGILGIISLAILAIGKSGMRIGALTSCTCLGLSLGICLVSVKLWPTLLTFLPFMVFSALLISRSFRKNPSNPSPNPAR
jgi:hypothetical protein